MASFYDIIPAAAKGRFDGIERNYKPEDVLNCAGQY